MCFIFHINLITAFFPLNVENVLFERPTIRSKKKKKRVPAHHEGKEMFNVPTISLRLRGCVSSVVRFPVQKFLAWPGLPTAT